MKGMFKWESWLAGLWSAFIGGFCGAIVSGASSMGFAPDKFNFTDPIAFHRLIYMVMTNSLFSGVLSIAFYLKQSPLPDKSTGNTDFIQKPADNPPQPKAP
jgi:hypothetical protein